MNTDQEPEKISPVSIKIEAFTADGRWVDVSQDVRVKTICGAMGIPAHLLKSEEIATLTIPGSDYPKP